MVVALVMLVLLTLIGISATTTSEIEIQTAGSHKFFNTAFYNADSGIYTTPKVISRSVDAGEQPDLSQITYLESAPGDFYSEIMGYKAHDEERDLSFALGGQDVEMDVERTGQRHLVGGGVQFASGAEGVGAGSSGSVAVFYTMDSLGEGPGSARSNLEAVYRKVLGIAGGL
jgi:hypothetical protein